MIVMITIGESDLMQLIKREIPKNTFVSKTLILLKEDSIPNSFNHMHTRMEFLS